MLNLKNLNKSSTECNKKICVSELELNKFYPILKLKRIPTKYGISILVEIEKGVFFLPKRLTEFFSEEYCVNYNTNSLLLKYVGTMPIPGYNAAHKFEFQENR